MAVFSHVVSGYSWALVIITNLSIVDPQDIEEPADREKLQKESLNTHHSHEYDCLSSIKIDLNTPLDRELFLQQIRNISKYIFRIKE